MVPSENQPLDNGQWFTFAVGAVVVSANLVDVAAGTLYAAVLNSDLGATVAYGQPFSMTADSCLAAMSALPAHDLLDQARAVLVDARAAYEKRNQIAHGVWQPGVFVDDPRSIVRFKRGGKVDSRIWTQPKLMELADHLVALAERINDVAVRIHDYRCRR